MLACRGAASTSTWARSCESTSCPRFLSSSSRSWGKAPSGLANLRSLDTEQHHRLAREWSGAFVPEDIPKNAYEIKYARSSGPGGQHVNKTNSKAVVRMPLDSALGSWLPRYCMTELVRSPYYVSSPPALQVSSQVTRSASSNAEAAVGVLYKTLLSAATAPIIGETSEEQRARVRSLAAADKAKRRVLKDKQHASKASRRGEW